MDNGLKWGGIGATVLYGAAVGTYVWLDWFDIHKLAPNEWGDFFAGIFSPLAFLWLVLGFFQQGKELRQNNKALELQASELRNAVEQYRELVNVSRDQFSYMQDAAIRQISPRLMVSVAHEGGRVNDRFLSFEVRNYGHQAEYFSAQYRVADNWNDLFSINVLTDSTNLRKELLFKSEPKVIYIRLQYSRTDGHRQVDEYEVTHIPGEGGFLIFTVTQIS